MAKMLLFKNLFSIHFRTQLMVFILLLSFGWVWGHVGENSNSIFEGQTLKFRSHVDRTSPKTPSLNPFKKETVLIFADPATAHFRSNVNAGSWDVPESWESSIDGSTGWNTATLAPTSDANTITIRSGHIITVNSSVTVDQLIIANGGQLTVDSTTGILQINNGIGTDIDIQENGILQIIGTTSYASSIVFSANATLSVSGKITIGDGTSTIGSGYDGFGFANASQISWNHNAVLEWNTIGALPDLSGQIYFPDVLSTTVPIFRITKIGLGNLGGDSATVINGLFQLNGTSLAWGGTSFKRFRNGIVAIGTGTMNRNAGTGEWQVGGDSAEIGGVGGSLTLNNPSGISILPNCTATLTSNITSSSGVFSNIGILNMGIYAISGTGAFATRTGSSLITSNSGGLVSAIALSGAKTFEINSNYIFNASTTTPFPIDTFGNPASLTFNNAVVYSNRTSNITVFGAVNVKGTSLFALNPTTNSLNLGGILTVEPLATFDTGGENQIVISSGGSPSIVVNGRFITRHTKGFSGATTAIPSIGITLGSNSIVEYGLNGNQIISPFSYRNITFSGGGTKTTQSAISVDNNGIVKITGNTTVDATSNLASTDANSTALSMDGGRLIIRTGGTQPNMDGAYNLTGGIVEFAGTSSKTIRSPRSYQNIEVTGSNVGNSSGFITLKNNGAFTVKSGGVFTINGNAIVGPDGTQTVTIEDGGTFKTGDPDGFSGGTGTSIRNDIESIVLLSNSTVEYSRASDQVITDFTPGYKKLKISGGGVKTLNTLVINVENSVNVTAGLLKIESFKTLNIEGPLITVATDTVALKGVYIKNAGSLVQKNLVNNGTSGNVGEILMERRTPPMFRYDFTYWTSPVKDFILKEVSPITLFDKFFSWKQTDQVWLPHPTLASSPTELMDAGRGYSIRAPQDFAIEAAGAVAKVHSAKFFGVPNNGTITAAIFGHATDVKWNLIGNPYPSALDGLRFLEDLDNIGLLEGTIYYWTHNSAPTSTDGFYYTYASADYASWNTTGGVTTCSGCLPATGKIGAGQSFFVKGIGSGAGVATFKNSMREINNNTQFYKSSADADPAVAEAHRIWLNLAGTTNGFSQTLIGYLDGATNGLDSQFDGDSFGGNQVTFYSIVATKNLVIQGRTLPFTVQDSVALGYKTTLTGNLTISIDHADGLLENQAVYLKDNVLNVTHDLRASNYVFASIPGTFDTRFVLLYMPQEALTNPTFTDQIKGVSIRKNGAELDINSPYETIEHVRVYDLMGRLVFEQQQCNSNSFTTNHIVGNDQTLIVKVQLLNGGVVTGKVY